MPRVLTVLAALTLTTTASAAVDPMLSTTWGQGGDYKSATPVRSGDTTYPGCTTVATAQVLYHYRYQDHAASDVAYSLEHDGVSGPDITDGVLSVDLTAHSYDFDAMAATLDDASAAEVDATAEFIYHVGVTLNAQFGGGEGSSATGKQLENALRYQWGFNNVRRRDMSIIAKDAFGYSDAEWADVIRAELDAGRPVLHLAQQVGADAGHAFVIDGYRDDGTVHVNWGWGGYGNGYYDPNSLTDPSGRSWSRDAMIFRGLEPEAGFAADMNSTTTEVPDYAWQGNGSLISAASGSASGYGLTMDEAMVHADADGDPIVFFQWEVDASDGTRLKIGAEGHDRATITYGPWGDRSTDRRYADVALPFVLDPTTDGFSDSYYVVAVAFESAATTSGIAWAEVTNDAATGATSLAATPFTVEGATWTGTGSLIGNASGTATGYGLTRDEAHLSADATAPAVYFQWEIDPSDGTTVVLDAAGVSSAKLRYGSWSTRDDDIVRTVTLPYTLDPSADGLPVGAGEFYTIELAFSAQITEDTVVTATVE